jgi:hypothetical protein
MRKVLWMAEHGSKDHLLERAQYVRAQAVAIRSDYDWLEAAIPEIQAEGFSVYAWRWPACRPYAPPPGGHNPPHWYALDEATYIVRLIQAGLDGYIADPEGDNDQGHADWDYEEPHQSPTNAELAVTFCDTIKIAGRKKNPKFLFGLTSGNRYPQNKPHIPWPEFVAHADALYPQCYWWADGVAENGGTAQSAYDLGVNSWNQIAPLAMPIVPIIGHITQPGDGSPIAAFQQVIDAHKLSEFHIYTCSDASLAAEFRRNWDALRNLS